MKIHENCYVCKNSIETCTCDPIILHHLVQSLEDIVKIHHSEILSLRESLEEHHNEISSLRKQQEEHSERLEQINHTIR